MTGPQWTVDAAGNPAWDHERLWDITAADLAFNLWTACDSADAAHAALVECVRDSATLAKAREPDLERFAAAVHRAYLDTCARLGWDVKPANAVPYDELPEDAKELDRASVRAVLDLLTEVDR